MGGVGFSDANFDVVPLPNEIISAEGDAFTLTSSTKIVYPEGNELLKRNAEFLVEYLNISTGLTPNIYTKATDGNAVILNTDL